MWRRVANRKQVRNEIEMPLEVVVKEVRREEGILIDRLRTEDSQAERCLHSL